MPIRSFCTSAEDICMSRPISPGCGVRTRARGASEPVHAARQAVQCVGVDHAGTSRVLEEPETVAGRLAVPIPGPTATAHLPSSRRWRLSADRRPTGRRGRPRVRSSPPEGPATSGCVEAGRAGQGRQSCPDRGSRPRGQLSRRRSCRAPAMTAVAASPLWAAARRRGTSRATSWPLSEGSRGAPPRTPRGACRCRQPRAAPACSAPGWTHVPELGKPKVAVASACAACPAVHRGRHRAPEGCRPPGTVSPLRSSRVDDIGRRALHAAFEPGAEDRIDHQRPAP